MPTSGRGERVYFSESLIVFTSNLGIYREHSSGELVANVDPAEPYEQVQWKVREAIEQHFKLVLNRPEILNRIGENIIVFDFIRPDVAGEIFEQLADSTLADLAKLSLSITLSAPAREALREPCLADLGHGGRGIRNQLEAYLINPLARALFDQGAQAGQRFEIRQLDAYHLELIGR